MSTYCFFWLKWRREGEFKEIHVSFFEIKWNSYYCCSVAKLCPNLCDPMQQNSLCFSISWSSHKLMSIELVVAIHPSHPLSHPSRLPLIFPSIRVFSNELASHKSWPKYWSFSISLSNEYSGLMSFSIDWFDLLIVHGTLKSLLQHHRS